MKYFQTRLAILIPFLTVTVANYLQQISYAGGVHQFLDLNRDSILCYDSKACNRVWFSVFFNEQYSAALTAKRIVEKIYVMLSANALSYFFYNHATFFVLGVCMRDLAKQFSNELMESTDNVQKVLISSNYFQNQRVHS